MVLLVTLTALAPLLLTGCASGIILAVIAVAAAGGGGGGGGGGPSGPIGVVGALQPVSDLTLPSCLDGLDQEDLKVLGGLRDFINNRVVKFDFDLDIRCQGCDRPPEELRMNVFCDVLTDGRPLMEQVPLGEFPSGSQMATLTLPEETGLVGSETLKLKVYPEVGDGARAEIVVNNLGRSSHNTLENVTSLDCGAVLAGSLRLEFLTPVTPTRQECKLVVKPMDPPGPLFPATSVTCEAATGGDRVIVHWNSADKDFRDKSGKVLCFLVVKDLENPPLASVTTTCETITVNNTKPQVFFDDIQSEPPGVDEHAEKITGRVVIRYRIADAGSDPCSLEVSATLLGSGKVLSTHPEQGEEPLTEATVLNNNAAAMALQLENDGLADLESSPGSGTVHQFVWNSDADIDRLNRDTRSPQSPAIGRVEFILRVTNGDFSCGTLTSESNSKTRTLDNSLMHAAAGIRAGRTRQGADDIKREDVVFSRLSSIATDIAADTDMATLYLTDSGTSTFWRMDLNAAAHDLSRLAGGGVARSEGVLPKSGPAPDTRLDFPVDVAVDGDEVFLLERSGVLSRILRGFYTPLLSFEVLNRPEAITLEKLEQPQRRFLYIADTQNCRVIRYDVSQLGDSVTLDGRGDVILGSLRDHLNLKDFIGPDYPRVKNGCNFQSSADENGCSPGDTKAPAGLAVYASTNDHRYLLVSEPLKDRIVRLDLGPASNPDPLPTPPAELPVFLEKRSGLSCPTEELFSHPKRLLLVDDRCLFIVCDGVRVDTSRGVVLRVTLTENANGEPEPMIETLEHIAGQRDPRCEDDTEAVLCGCTDSTDDTFRVEDEGVCARNARLAQPSAVVIDKEGAIYIADQHNQRVRRLTLEGGVCGSVGTCEQAIAAAGAALADGPGVLKTFVGKGPQGKTAREEFVGLNEIQIIAPAGENSCLRASLPRGEAAILSQFSEVRGMTFIDDATVLLADAANHRARILDLEGGVIATFAGREAEPPEVEVCLNFEGDGAGSPATEALFGEPRAIAVFPPYRPRSGEPSRFWCDPARRVYIVDRTNHLVRLVNANGVVSTFAGSGLKSKDNGNCCLLESTLPDDVSNQGLGRTAARPKDVFLKFPRAIVVDSQGRVFIADCRHRVLMVNREGTKLRRVVGKGTEELRRRDDGGDGFISKCRPLQADDPIGDNGPAVEAALSLPTEMAFDAAEEFLYLADSGHGRIRRARYDKEKTLDDADIFGEIITVAGNGVTEDTLVPGDICLATQVGLKNPIGLDFDPVTNTLLVTTESAANLYRIVIDDGNPGRSLIEKLAGPFGSLGDGNDGQDARFFSPSSVRLDAVGNVYVVDTRNNRLRRFFPEPPPALGDVQCSAQSTREGQGPAGQ